MPPLDITVNLPCKGIYIKILDGSQVFCFLFFDGTLV